MTIIPVSLGEALQDKKVSFDRKWIAQRNSEGRFILSETKQYGQNGTQGNSLKSVAWSKSSDLSALRVLRGKREFGGAQCTKLITAANSEPPTSTKK
jgi:hypothetical protein